MRISDWSSDVCSSDLFGTLVSRIDILRAVLPGEPYQTVPGVTPGGEVLLRVNGWPKVQRVFEAIDTVDALGIDPADAAHDHWRHVHNRLAANENQIGRAHVCTPVTNAPLVCTLLLEKKHTIKHQY